VLLTYSWPALEAAGKAFIFIYFFSVMVVLLLVNQTRDKLNLVLLVAPVFLCIKFFKYPG
jgi:hypothetical protein